MIVQREKNNDYWYIRNYRCAWLRLGRFSYFLHDSREWKQQGI